MSYRWWIEPTIWQAEESKAPDARKAIVVQMPRETRAPVGFAPTVPRPTIVVATPYRKKP